MDTVTEKKNLLNQRYGEVEVIFGFIVNRVGQISVYCSVDTCECLKKRVEKDAEPFRIRWVQAGKIVNR